MLLEIALTESHLASVLLDAIQERDREVPGTSETVEKKKTGDSVSGRMRTGLGQQHQGAGKSYATVLLTYCI